MAKKASGNSKSNSPQLSLKLPPSGGGSYVKSGVISPSDRVVHLSTKQHDRKREEIISRLSSSGIFKRDN